MEKEAAVTYLCIADDVTVTRGIDMTLHVSAINVRSALCILSLICYYLFLNNRF